MVAGLALAAVLATTARAQQMWTAQFGIQGGYSRLVQPGTSGYVDVLSLPGFNVGPAAPFPLSAYVVVPWKPKLALEPEVGFAQLAAGAGVATLWHVGLRGDYALSEQFYAAAGGMMGYINSGGANERQFGLQVAAGYRKAVSPTLNGRLEARVGLWGKTDNLPPFDVYSVLLGVSTRSTGARAARTGARAGAARAWSPAVGLAGGYAVAHAVGSASDILALALPGWGGGLAGFGSPEATLPPTLFVILPMGTKTAIEPGVDIHRVQSNGNTTFSGNLSLRLNYAVSGGWYAAGGANLGYIKETGTDAATRTGLNVAWGYRFPFTGPLGGRVEANYTLWGKQTDLGIPPINTFGAMLGLTMPLK